MLLWYKSTRLSTDKIMATCYFSFKISHNAIANLINRKQPGQIKWLVYSQWLTEMLEAIAKADHRLSDPLGLCNDRWLLGCHGHGTLLPSNTGSLGHQSHMARLLLTSLFLCTGYGLYMLLENTNWPVTQNILLFVNGISVKTWQGLSHWLLLYNRWHYGFSNHQTTPIPGTALLIDFQYFFQELLCCHNSVADGSGFPSAFIIMPMQVSGDSRAVVALFLMISIQFMCKFQNLYAKAHCEWTGLVMGHRCSALQHYEVVRKIGLMSWKQSGM